MTNQTTEERRIKHNELTRNWYSRNKEKYRETKNRYLLKHPEARKATVLKYQLSNPERFLVKCSKYNAKRAGIPHSITEADIFIPAQCPVFNVPFQKTTPFAMSIDRIDSTKGYVPGNVQIISRKANVMKNNASPEELRLFAKWILN